MRPHSREADRPSNNESGGGTCTWRHVITRQPINAISSLIQYSALVSVAFVAHTRRECGKLRHQKTRCCHFQGAFYVPTSPPSQLKPYRVNENNNFSTWLLWRVIFFSVCSVHLVFCLLTRRVLAGLDDDLVVSQSIMCTSLAGGQRTCRGPQRRCENISNQKTG